MDSMTRSRIRCPSETLESTVSKYLYMEIGLELEQERCWEVSLQSRVGPQDAVEITAVKMYMTTRA